MTSVSMDMEKLKTPCIACGDVKWCTQFGNLLTLFVDLVFCNLLMLGKWPVQVKALKGKELEAGIWNSDTCVNEFENL